MRPASAEATAGKPAPAPAPAMGGGPDAGKGVRIIHKELQALIAQAKPCVRATPSIRPRKRPAAERPNRSPRTIRGALAAGPTGGIECMSSSTATPNRLRAAASAQDSAW